MSGAVESGLSLAGRRWTIAPADPAAAAAIVRELGLPRPLAQCLAARGFDAASAERWLGCAEEDFVHDPARLAGLPEAVAEAERALAEDRHIRIFGDYDADGVTAAAILMENLAAVGASVDVRLPERDRGYGLQPADVDRAAADGAGLLIAVDNGVRAFEAAERAAELGLPLVILDHHRPEAELPRAAAVVNPHRADDGYPFKELCGAGLALKFAQLLQGMDADAPWRRSLDLAAVGTVGDVVPLVDENRWIVRAGLRLLGESPRPGLAALLEVGGARRPAGAHELAYVVAPRLNAAGRLGDPVPALACVLAEGPQARDLALQLDAANRRRQALERAALEEARALAAGWPKEEPVIVLGSPSWHPGVVGLVAGRLARERHRPVLLAAVEGERARGSGRSIPAFDLHAALEACRRHFEAFGGHRQAAGFMLPAAALAALRRDVNEHARAVLSPEDLVPELVVDARLELHEVDDALCEALSLLEPFGAGNPRPRFLVPDVSLEVRTAGREGEHALLACYNARGARLEGVAFGFGRALASAAEGRWRLVAVPELDEWNGAARVRLRVEDAAAAAPADLSAARETAAARDEAPSAATGFRARAATGFPAGAANGMAGARTGAAARAALLERLAERVRERHPDRDRLARLYSACRRAAAGGVPALPADPFRLAARLQEAGAGAVTPEEADLALRVFADLGLAVRLRKGADDVWWWSPPPEGKLDLRASAAFREGEALRARLAALHSWLEADEAVWQEAVAQLEAALEAGA
ncbi:MAG: single-stranded-DNA-specific exonuclease RecJ [Firmicutes bacterium]|nr:single-stranded-DNA-specific exonuclease RecJ [Bacillota bacterium]